MDINHPPAFDQLRDFLANFQKPLPFYHMLNPSAQPTTSITQQTTSNQSPCTTYIFFHIN